MKRFLTISSILMALLGSLFAAYDMFPAFHTFNNKIPVCSRLNGLLKEIEPYTTNSKASLGSFPTRLHLNKEDDGFKELLNIIRMNYDVPVDKDIVEIDIGVWKFDSGTRLGGFVHLKDATDDIDFVGRPDILVEWIKSFRQSWFLKWGLIFIALGALTNLIAVLIPDKK